MTCYPLIRRLLFLLPAEFTHHAVLTGLVVLHKLGFIRRPSWADSQPVSLIGLNFLNPVGLSAGFDTNGRAIDALGALGFGFVEVGAVTPLAQAGQAKPRLFRFPRHEALVNRMGFPNNGVDALVKQITRSHFKGVLGVNIGKNANTPLNEAHKDYLLCIEKLYPHVDYITLNVSSPNTQGLRSLQGLVELQSLLSRVGDKVEQLQKDYGKNVPILVKLAPDIPLQEIKELAAILVDSCVTGVVLTNTTRSRQDDVGKAYTGGLSGEPLLQKSNQFLSAFRREAGDKLVIIGVGGVVSKAAAQSKIEAGADLIALYTGLVYRGPRLIREVVSLFADSAQ